MMVFTSRVCWGAIAAILLYIVVALSVDNVNLTYAVRTLQAAFCFGGLAAYYKAGMEVFTVKIPTRYQLAAFGIALMFFAYAINGTWLVLWRLSDHPYWFVNNDVYSFFVYLAVVATIIMIATPGALRGAVLSENQIIIGLAVAFSFLLILTAMFMKPDLTDFIKNLEPYLSSE